MTETTCGKRDAFTGFAFVTVCGHGYEHGCAECPLREEAVEEGE
jgi:hypothetical protein